ncbi:outer membrane beta-barrel protein [Pedobacter chitinilyticus]|uniref:PorT family protein n=1 Tax=Pedobacter chitinilyticus TaxID=2233776 RepID=A0A3S3SUS2_9SPHI|nr:outer membrane beta-barrel protein [Pedobacter chitinilyticus]RWU10817.1 PorT family protein [Pedobacter chitinilyticus]
MYKYLLLTFLLLGSTIFTFAQNSGDTSSKFEHNVQIGYNIGGLAPISFPNTIRKINSYSPGFSPSFGYELNYRLHQKWGLAIGLRVDWKSMSVQDSVQYFHTLVSMDNATIEGDFSGTNTTKVKNIYLAVPIQALFYAGNHWKLKLGVYLAHLVHPSFYGSVSDGYLRKGDSLGEKVIIDYASFDFDKEQRTFDFGISAGAEKLIYKNFAAKADLQWGLQPVFPDSFNGISFNMYNIYGTLGVSYRF